MHFGRDSWLDGKVVLDRSNNPVAGTLYKTAVMRCDRASREYQEGLRLDRALQIQLVWTWHFLCTIAGSMRGEDDVSKRFISREM
jgi:hypothetical protein